MNELEKQLAEFKASLENKTIEELQDLEKTIVEEAQEADKMAAEKTFELREADGSKLTATRRASIGKIIANFLAKAESNWQQALTVKYLLDFWQSKNNVIAYPVLDNTLRMLGGIKFQGVQEIQNVSAVNDFFEAIREEFMGFTNKLYEVANRHDIVMNEIQLRTAAPEKE